MAAAARRKQGRRSKKVACASQNPPRLGALPRSKLKGGEVFTLIQRNRVGLEGTLDDISHSARAPVYVKKPARYGTKTVAIKSIKFRSQRERTSFREAKVL